MAKAPDLALVPRLRDLAKRRRKLLDQPIQWWSRNSINRELQQINREIDELLDKLNGLTRSS